MAQEIGKDTAGWNDQISNFNFLPLDEAGRPKAVKKWSESEDAWTQVTEALRGLLSG